MIFSEDNKDTFIFEEIDRFKLTVSIDNKDVITTDNNLTKLANIYYKLVNDNINSEKHIIVTIFDYNKNTNIYSYDSEQDRC